MRKRTSLEAAKSGDAIYVRIHGLGNMANAPTLDMFIGRALDEGARQFVFDLAECAGVDSTFMGTMLALSKRLMETNTGQTRSRNRSRGKQAGPPGVVVINLDAHARKQLSSVGLDAFMTLKPGRTELPRNLKLTALSVPDVSHQERLKLMVRAHRELVAADARNKAKFGAFLEGIVAELE